jgi:hypothetical protein
LLVGNETFCLQGGLLIAKFIAGLGLVVACSLLFRGVSRWRQPMYANFMQVLTTAHRQNTQQTKVKEPQKSFLIQIENVDDSVLFLCSEAVAGV